MTGAALPSLGIGLAVDTGLQNRFWNLPDGQQDRSKAARGTAR